MFGLGDDQHPFGLDRFPDDIGGLGGQHFLRRRAAGEDFNHPRQVRKTGNFIVTRNIRYMGFAEKRQEMMFAHRVKRDVADNDQLVAVFRSVQGYFLPGIHPQPGKRLFIEIGDPFRRFRQAFTLDILADPFQNQSDTVNDFLLINRSGGFFQGPTRLYRLRIR